MFAQVPNIDKGFSLIKLQLAEFLRLVHITSEKRAPLQIEITHLHNEFALFVEMESRKIESICGGATYSRSYLEYLFEGVIPLVCSFHERIITQNPGIVMDDVVEASTNLSQRLAIALAHSMYKDIVNRR